MCLATRDQSGLDGIPAATTSAIDVELIGIKPASDFVDLATCGALDAGLPWSVGTAGFLGQSWAVGAQLHPRMSLEFGRRLTGLGRRAHQAASGGIGDDPMTRETTTDR